MTHDLLSGVEREVDDVVLSKSPDQRVRAVTAFALGYFSLELFRRGGRQYPDVRPNRVAERPQVVSAFEA